MEAFAHGRAANPLCPYRNPFRDLGNTTASQSRAFNMPDAYPDGIPYPGLTGLAFGEGDPQYASFENGGDWFVIRVAASDATVVDEVLPHWSWSGVRFKRGFVVYRGDRRGALEMVIMRGADPGRMAVQLALPGEQGVAICGKWGVAVGGAEGMPSQVTMAFLLPVITVWRAPARGARRRLLAAADWPSWALQGRRPRSMEASRSSRAIEAAPAPGLTELRSHWEMPTISRSDLTGSP